MIRPVLGRAGRLKLATTMRVIRERREALSSGQMVKKGGVPSAPSHS